jgi:hypothetical protein
MAQAEPPTRQEAAEQCWMSVEKTHRDLSLDKRADIVAKCIKEKIEPGAAPAAAAAKRLPKLAPDHDGGPSSKPPKAKT